MEGLVSEPPMSGIIAAKGRLWGLGVRGLGFRGSAPMILVSQGITGNTKCRSGAINLLTKSP